MVKSASRQRLRVLKCVLSAAIASLAMTVAPSFAAADPAVSIYNETYESSAPVGQEVTLRTNNFSYGTQSCPEIEIFGEMTANNTSPATIDIYGGGSTGVCLFNDMPVVTITDIEVPGGVQFTPGGEDQMVFKYVVNTALGGGYHCYGEGTTDVAWDNESTHFEMEGTATETGLGCPVTRHIEATIHLLGTPAEEQILITERPKPVCRSLSDGGHMPAVAIFPGEL